EATAVGDRVEVRAPEERMWRVGPGLQRRVVEEEIARRVGGGGQAQRSCPLAQPAVRVAPGRIVGEARDARPYACETREPVQRLGQRALCDLDRGLHR